MPNTGDIVKASDFQAIKPQLSIGTVTTGAAGTNASASITGTSPNFKLNLTIPRGKDGADGTSSWSTSMGSASSSKPAVITSSYRSGNTWYRVYSDGFIIQGGRTGNAQTGTVTYPRRFTSAVFTVLLTQQKSTTRYEDKYACQILGTPSVSSFNYAWGGGYVSSSWTSWCAFGY